MYLPRWNRDYKSGGGGNVSAVFGQRLQVWRGENVSAALEQRLRFLIRMIDKIKYINIVFNISNQKFLYINIKNYGLKYALLNNYGDLN